MKNKIPRWLQIFAVCSATLCVMVFSLNSGTVISTASQDCEKVIKLSQRSDRDYELVEGMSATLVNQQANANALESAVKAGVEKLASDANICRVTLRISEGSWYFAPAKVTENTVLQIPSLDGLKSNQVLAISGVGANLAKLYIAQNKTFVRNRGVIRNFQLSDFSLIQTVPDHVDLVEKDKNGVTRTNRYAYGLKTTQGSVTSDAQNYVEVEIYQGYPSPIALDSVARGECVPGGENEECEDKFLKRFERGIDGKPFFPFNEKRVYPIPANPRSNNYRVAYGRVENIGSGGRTVRVHLNNASSATGERIFVKGDLVAFKSKHGGLLLYVFDCSELSCSGLTFSGLIFSYEARGVIRNVNSVSIMNNRIAPIEPTPIMLGNIPVMATTAGGFQINGGKDHVVRDNELVGLGDDGIAFFEVEGEPDSTRISGNRIRDSWNRGIYIRSSREADSEAIAMDNCVSERGCARVGADLKKREFKQFLFHKPSGEDPLFRRTYIDYSNIVDLEL